MAALSFTTVPPPSINTIYTTSQLAAYESYIHLPYRYQTTTISSHDQKPIQRTQLPTFDLNYLTKLHTHQITYVPYENLTLHYDFKRVVSLDPTVLFDKIVGNVRGRGGYCMEGSILFNAVLRSLGFRVELRGVRIRPRVGGVPGGLYTGWVHIVNIVTLPNGEQYMLDVAFGGDGPTIPLPLNSSPSPPIFQNLGPQQIRLLHSTIPSSAFNTPNPDISLSPQYKDTTPAQKNKFWIYQYRNSSKTDKGEEMEWNSFYCFEDGYCFYPPDFEVMNWWTSTSVNDFNFQTKTVIVVKFLMAEREAPGIATAPENIIIESSLENLGSERLGPAEPGESKGLGKIVGKIMLVGDTVKRNDGGRTRVLKVFGNEEERVKGLKEYFGIELTGEEIAGIKGRNVELLEVKLEK